MYQGQSDYFAHYIVYHVPIKLAHGRVVTNRFANHRSGYSYISIAWDEANTSIKRDIIGPPTHSTVSIVP